MRKGWDKLLAAVPSLCIGKYYCCYHVFWQQNMLSQNVKCVFEVCSKRQVIYAFAEIMSRSF